ncbi:MAG: FMN-binding negative transcriptional regulator [Actinomycetota bacterium]|nr:FMN-binding negative transcriptional regulator [Actinomycetota bacterium]
MVAAVGAGELVTVGADGYPMSTLLPVHWEGDTVTAHFARANPHWRGIEPDAPALLVVTMAQAYVSPSWYAAKAEHGRVVPTWNYSAVQLGGRVRVHDDTDWVRAMVTTLTNQHESRREQPWRVDDAPPAYLEAQLRGIVGVELTVERVAGKAKLSQNRSEADREGVVLGLLAVGTRDTVEVAAAVRRGGAVPGVGCS